LVRILFPGCFNLFCNMWVCVCTCGFGIEWVFEYVGFVMCGCFDNCVGVLVIRVLVFTVFIEEEKENCALLCHNAANSGDLLPTFWDNLSVQSLGDKSSKNLG
jgi:hypothetical protein